MREALEKFKYNQKTYTTQKSTSSSSSSSSSRVRDSNTSDNHRTFIQDGGHHVNEETTNTIDDEEDESSCAQASEEISAQIQLNKITQLIIEQIRSHTSIYVEEKGILLQNAPTLQSSMENQTITPTVLRQLNRMPSLMA